MEASHQFNNTQDFEEIGGARPKSLPFLHSVTSERGKLGPCSKRDSSETKRLLRTDTGLSSNSKSLTQRSAQHKHPYPLETETVNRSGRLGMTSPYCLIESKEVWKKPRSSVNVRCSSSDEGSPSDKIELTHSLPSSVSNVLSDSDDQLSEWKKTGITLRNALTEGLSNSLCDTSQAYDKPSGALKSTWANNMKSFPVSNQFVGNFDGVPDLTNHQQYYRPDCVTEISSSNGDSEIRLHLIDDNLDDISFSNNSCLKDSSFFSDIRKKCDSLCNPDGLCLCFNLNSDFKSLNSKHPKCASLLENSASKKDKISSSSCKTANRTTKNSTYLSSLDGSSPSLSSASPHKPCSKLIAKQGKCVLEGKQQLPSAQYSPHSGVFLNNGVYRIPPASTHKHDPCSHCLAKHYLGCHIPEKKNGMCNSEVKDSDVLKNGNSSFSIDEHCISRKESNPKSQKCTSAERNLSKPEISKAIFLQLNEEAAVHTNSEKYENNIHSDDSNKENSPKCNFSSSETSIFDNKANCNIGAKHGSKNNDITTNNYTETNRFTMTDSVNKKPSAKQACICGHCNADENMQSDKIKSCAICQIIPLAIPDSNDSTFRHSNMLKKSVPVHKYCYSQQNSDQFTHFKTCPVSPRRSLSYLDTQATCNTVKSDNVLSSSNESDSTLEDVSYTIENRDNIALILQDESICSSSDNDVGSGVDGNFSVFDYTSGQGAENPFLTHCWKNDNEDLSSILRAFHCHPLAQELIKENSMKGQCDNFSSQIMSLEDLSKLSDGEITVDPVVTESKMLSCWKYPYVKGETASSFHSERTNDTENFCCYQKNIPEYEHAPECSFDNNCTEVCQSLWANSAACHDSKCLSCKQNLLTHHSDSQICNKWNHSNLCSVSGNKNCLESAAVCNVSPNFKCACMKQPDVDLQICRNLLKNDSSPITLPKLPHQEFENSKSKCTLAKECDIRNSTTVVDSPVRDVRSSDKSQDCSTEALPEKLTSSGTEEISNSERLTDSNITDSSSMYESVYVPEKHEPCNTHHQKDDVVRSPSHSGKHCVHSHREKSPFRKKRKDCTMKSRKRDVKNAKSGKTTMDSSTDCEQIEQSEPPSPEMVSPVNLDTLCGATSLTFSSDDFDYFEDDIFADFTNDDTAVSLTPEETDCTLVNKSFISALHYALPYLPDKYKTCLPKSPDRVSRGSCSKSKALNAASVDKSPSIEGFTETSPESEESDVVIPILVHSSDDSDADADDEFECDCEHCQLSSTHDFQSDISQISLDDQEATNDIDIRDAELDQRESGLYRISVDELSPLEFVLMRQDARRDMLEQMFQNFIMQMLAVHPDLLNDQAPPPASQETIDTLPSVVVNQPHIDEELSCPICLCLYILGEKLCCLPCQHLFHVLCIHAWLKKSGTCPVCRNIL